MTKITNQNYPNGLNPLGYMGVNAPTPGQQVVQLPRAPTTTDAQNFTIGTQWLANVSGVNQIWELVDLSQGIATWVQLYPAGGGSGGASEFPTDSGTANEVGGVLKILGDGENIGTEGSSNIVNVVLNDHITVQNVTIESMDEGAVVSDGSGNLTSINGTAGQVLTSNGPGMVPTFQGEAAGGAVTALRADNSFNVTPSVGIINVAGGNGITTSGASHTLTLNLTAPVSIANGGTNATSMANADGAVYFDGTRLVTTTVGTAGQVLTSNGAGMAPTFQPGGGAGIITLTANSGSATGSSVKIQGNDPITTTATAATLQVGITNGTMNGQLLISGGSKPVWNNLTSSGGTVAITYPSNNNINLEATGSSPATTCAFFYYQATIASNVTGGNAIYALGSAVPLTKQYDLGNNVFQGSGTGSPATFTAPATGIYFLNMQILTRNQGSDSTGVGNCIITVTGTSAQQYAAIQSISSGYHAPVPSPANMQLVIQMTAGDIATFQWYNATGGGSGGSNNASVAGAGNYLAPVTFAIFLPTWISGFRVA